MIKFGSTKSRTAVAVSLSSDKKATSTSRELSSKSTHMASSLTPSFQTIQAIRSSIQGALKNELPPDTLANIIAPFLVSVNQWSTQIPALLDASSSATSVNLVFAIRSDLFSAPRFTQNVFNIPLVDLPAPFQEFSAFIHKLIDAQKVDRDKPPPKVRLVRLETHFCIRLTNSFSQYQPTKRPGRIIKSKPYVDDDESVEITGSSVSLPVHAALESPSDESVRPFQQVARSRPTDPFCRQFSQAMVIDEGNVGLAPSPEISEDPSKTSKSRDLRKVFTPSIIS